MLCILRVLLTKRIVLAAVDYLEQRNLAILAEAQRTLASSSAAKSEEARAFDFDTTTYVSSELAPTSIRPAGMLVVVMLSLYEVHWV